MFHFRRTSFIFQILEKLVVVIQDGRQEDFLILDVSGDPVVNSGGVSRL